MRPVTVVTLGEALLRLFAAHGMALESARSLRISVAGSESNVAAGLARLGVHAVWLSKLPRNALGRRIVAELRALGVDTSHVVWAPEGRLGLYFTQQGLTPEELHVIYDRQGSAFSTLVPEEVPWEVVRSASLVHLSGITPALGAGPLAVSRRLVQECRQAGIPISFDVNYRSRLWDPGTASQILSELLAGVSLLICSERDARTVFRAGPAESAGRELWARFHPGLVVVTMGAQGAMAWDGRQLIHVPAVAAPVVDRIGRGDAFDAGLIEGFLRGDVLGGLRQGAALAALVQSRWGDVPWTGPEELAQVLAARPADQR